jgi:hypothetical protein
MEPTRVLFASVFIFGIIDIILGVIIYAIFPAASIYLLTGVITGVILIVGGAIGFLRSPSLARA